MASLPIVESRTSVLIAVSRGLRRSSRSSTIVPWLILLAFAIGAILAPVISPYSPINSNPAGALQPPSFAHPFGTDTYGLDVLSRVIWAARWDISISISGILLAVFIGTPLGALGAYAAGATDDTMSRLVEAILSFPLFLFALMVFAALGNKGGILVGIIAFVYAPLFFKLTRSLVLPLKEADFVLAARCAGLNPLRIVIKHMIPNSLGPLAAQFSMMCSYSLQVVAGLSFLGLGVPLPYPEWGAMVQEGAGRIIFGQWWPALFPGLAILLVVMALQGIGRQLQRHYSN